mgnify:CR=1 FL=1
MYYQNVRGLKTKLNDFYCAVLSEEYPIIVLTETWLSDDIISTSVFDDRYIVFRTDRNAINSVKSHGGGVLIAVNKYLKSSQIMLNDSLGKSCGSRFVLNLVP